MTATIQRGGHNAHLNLTRPLQMEPVDKRHRDFDPVAKYGRDIEPYRDEPRRFAKVPFAGADPFENEDW